MSFFKKILGKKTSQPAAGAPGASSDAAQPVNPPTGYDDAPEQASTAAPQADEAAQANMMPMLDEQGRQVMVMRPEWRERVLLPHLEKVRENPDELAGTIMHSLQNGFLTDMVEPAEQLARIDPNAERGAIVLSIVYRELERFESAETVLQQHVAKHGENANVVFHMGLVHAARSRQEEAEQAFWRALELEPNHRDACGALLASRHQIGGDAAVQEALARMGQLPGNWRARMWHARAALDRNDVQEAVRLYREAIALTGKPVPTDLLLQMSGDLGGTGHPDVMLQEAAPLFEVEVHGLPGAHNLFRACLVTGQLQAARALLDLLFGQQRLDWRPHLGQWESEFAQVRNAELAKKVMPGSGTATLLIDEGPIWLPPQSPANELFTVPVGEVPSIAFLGSSADSPAAEPKEGESALRASDGAARFSRAVPLFLAEQLRFGLQARTRPVVPWVAGDAPAFLVGRQPWTAAETVQHARGVKPECQYAVVTHIQAQAEPWRVEARLVRVADAAELGTVAVELSINEPEQPLRTLAAEVSALIEREAGVATATPPAEYVVPTGQHFGLYLLCLEQLHSVRCHSVPGVPPGTLLGERDLLDASLHLCILQPENIGARLIFLELLRMLRTGRPQVVLEYRSRVELLQKEKPLPGAAQAVLQRLFDMLYTGAPKKD
ncbi:MAG TPA: tetratricopeptide repeat protein [Opitutaceae bacterium]|nr:tetratricopeptide repeat protein [Opitutaceae bacterium]